MFIDAKKAHLNPRCREDVYVELPAEAGMGPGFCGKLNYWLYGFRKAASEWERFFAEAGFRRGGGCPVLFYHPKRDLSVVVHGDDFVPCGFDQDLKWAAQYIAKCFEVQLRAVLGGSRGRQGGRRVGQNSEMDGLGHRV